MADTGEVQAKSGGYKKIHPDAGIATRFKPGQSGNPDGKPKGTKHINSWIQELLEDEDFEADLIDSKKGLVEFKGAPIKAIILAQRHKAVNGDQKAVDLLLKYGWPAKNETDLTSNGQGIAPVLVKFMGDDANDAAKAD